MAAKRSEKPRSATTKKTADVAEKRTAEAAVAEEGEQQLQTRLSDVESRERRAENTEIALRARYDTLVAREQSAAEREKSVAEREAAMATRESRVAAREHALLESERDFGKRGEEINRRERDLETRARALDAKASALDARDEEMGIREAAIDEAMSLATEGLQAPRTVEGDDEVLFEGPDLAAAPQPAPPAPRASAAGEPDIAADEARLRAVREALDEARKQAEQQAAEEHRRLVEEGENFLVLARTIPVLEAFVPRVQKAMSGSLNATVLLAFYNMAVRQLAERLNAAPSEERMAALEVAVAERQKALDDANARITTLKEDFDRHRTRVKNEQEAFATRANEELLRRIVPAVDNFERALTAAAGAANVEAILSGVKMIQRQFEDILSQEGLVPVKAIGLPFDPRVHEALMEVAAVDVADETVVEEIQRGYHLGGKLFRPALVKVARIGAGGGAPAVVAEG